MSIKLIIFDLDGTLVDTAVDMAGALNAVLPAGVPPISVEEARAVMGGGDDTLASRLRRGRSEADWREFGKRFAKAYAARLPLHTKPYPGVLPTLKKLSRFPKVVLTNRRTAFTMPVLERFGLLPYFLDVIGSDSGAGMKPSPEPVLHAVCRFDAAPEEAIMVGDCIYDVEAGRAAGVRTVAVTYGYGVGSAFTERADFTIDRFSRLLGIIDLADCG